jgi:hypothetical protein
MPRRAKTIDLLRVVDLLRAPAHRERPDRSNVNAQIGAT